MTKRGMHTIKRAFCEHVKGHVRGNVMVGGGASLCVAHAPLCRAIGAADTPGILGGAAAGRRVRPRMARSRHSGERRAYPRSG